MLPDAVSLCYLNPVELRATKRAMDSDTIKGLTAAEVDTRVAAGQTNDAGEQTSRSVKDILHANLLTRFNALLLVLFVAVLVVGSPADGLFGFVIVINSAIRSEEHTSELQSH